MLAVPTMADVCVQTWIQWEEQPYKSSRKAQEKNNIPGKQSI